MLYVSIAIAATRNASTADGRICHGRNAFLRTQVPTGEEDLWTTVKPGMYWVPFVNGAFFGSNGEYIGYAHPARCAQATGLPNKTLAVDAATVPESMLSGL